MFLIIFLIVFVLILLYLLFTPIILYIDTNSNQYYLNFKGVCKAKIETSKEGLFVIRIKLFFLNFSFDPFKKRKTVHKTKQVGKNKSSRRTKRISFQTGIRLFNTFKIKKIRIDIDTGDYIFNAKLYPIFAFMNYRFGGFHVNFENRNQLVLQIQNRPIDIIKVFINI